MEERSSAEPTAQAGGELGGKSPADHVLSRHAAGFALFGIALFLLFRSYPDLDSFISGFGANDKLFSVFRAHYLPAAKALVAGEALPSGYVYPVAFAVAMEPFTWLSKPGALLAWGWLQVASTLLIALAPLKQLKRRPALIGPWLAVLALSWPILHGIRWGQVSTLVVGLGFVATTLIGRASWQIGAPLLATAVTIKLFPVIYLGSMIDRRRLPSAIVTIAWLLMIAIAFPILSLGVDGFIYQSQEVSAEIYRIGMKSLRHPDTQSVWAVIPRWFGMSSPRSDHARAAATIVSCILAAAALLGVTVARDRQDWAARAWRFTLLTAIVPAMATSVWPHYFAWIPLAAFCLLVLVLDSPGSPILRGAVLALSAIAVVLSSQPIALALGGWREYASSGLLLAAHFFVITAAVVATPLLRNSGRDHSAPSFSGRIAEPDPEQEADGTDQR